ncbi:hypothetical protein WN944_007830 [Citrus x changshan-huyou]
MDITTRLIQSKLNQSQSKLQAWPIGINREPEPTRPVMKGNMFRLVKKPSQLGVVLSTRNYQLLNMKAGSGYGREHPANWSLS